MHVVSRKDEQLHFQIKTCHVIQTVTTKYPVMLIKRQGEMSVLEKETWRNISVQHGKEIELERLKVNAVTTDSFRNATIASLRA